MESSAKPRLFASEPAARDAVVRIEGERRTVIVAGVVVAHVNARDRMAAAQAMVDLRLTRSADT